MSFVFKIFLKNCRGVFSVCADFRGLGQLPEFSHKLSNRSIRANHEKITDKANTENTQTGEYSACSRYGAADNIKHLCRQSLNEDCLPLTHSTPIDKWMVTALSLVMRFEGSCSICFNPGLEKTR